MRTALFAGSFDPFTLGHRSIVERTLVMADEVVVAIGNNINKRYMFGLDERLAIIRRAFADEPRVKVMTYEGLTTDFAQQIGATFLVRGVRTVADFEYEKTISHVNRMLTGIETILLITDPQYAHISSSLVRELLTYGKDVSHMMA